MKWKIKGSRTYAYSPVRPTFVWIVYRIINDGIAGTCLYDDTFKTWKSALNHCLRNSIL